MRGWRELETQSGEELLGLYGLVEVASSPELTSASALDACGLGYRLLDGDEARALGVALPEGWAALHQPEAGVVRADLARRAFLDVAVSRGARLETGRRVVSPDDVDADVVVVTAGAWVTDFVPDLPVSVTRETIAYFRREGPAPPSVVELNEETRGHAMYALHDPVHGLKAGAHHAGPGDRPERGRRAGRGDCRADLRVGARAPPGCRSGAGRYGDVHLHECRRRVVRARAPRPRRRRLGLLGPRLQVRSGGGAEARGTSPFAKLRFATLRICDGKGTRQPVQLRRPRARRGLHRPRDRARASSSRISATARTSSSSHRAATGRPPSSGAPRRSSPAATRCSSRRST